MLELFAWLVPRLQRLRIFLSELGQLHLVVIFQLFQRARSSRFVLLHIAVPRLRELLELLPLNLLHICELVRLGGSHASHLPLVFKSLEQRHLFTASFCLKVVQLIMALVQVVLH